jgi:ATP-binding cassette, subfamily F, member 3
MFPGKIDAFLEYQQELREHLIRSNAAVLSKRKNLEEFIAKNKARASTATRARSKSKQLERLETVDIVSEDPAALIRVPQVEPRKGPALRCRGVTIGYPERSIATDIDLEIEHGSRAAIVGDNGQGKTTFLRTIVDSLKPLTGEVRWGYGCNVGVYAQHVYSTLPENKTVLDYLEDNAAPGTKNQEILDLAGALLFRGEQVKKRISVLSGGERARLCMAGLLLSPYNILILDEPGNHLDVDTVEALATALLGYKGTVIFTSHDRHFMKRVASCIIEVRDGHVTNYRGDYEAYLYSVNKEIEDGERELAAQSAKSVVPGTATKSHAVAPRMNERDLQKEMKKIEKTVVRLAAQKRQIDQDYQAATKSADAMRLHEELKAVTSQLAEAEEKWCELQAQLGEY